MASRYDAIVVGGGPAGASAAILLAAAGWKVAVVEKAAYPRRKVCGECIAPSNWPLFEAMGVAPAIAAVAGPPILGLALVSGDEVVRCDFPSAAQPAHPWGRAVLREHLDPILLERARALGAQVLQPCLASWVKLQPGRYLCSVRQLAGGASAQAHGQLEAPVLIDAQGSWSSHGQRQRQRKAPSDLLAFKLNFTGAALERHTLQVLSFAGGYGGMVASAPGVATLAFCIRRDALAACRSKMPGGSAAEAAAAHVMRACPSVRRAFALARPCGGWLGAGPLRPGIRVAADNDAFLVGNAAGEAHPIIGEGISMAMQSAWLLAERLTRVEPARLGAMSEGQRNEIALDYARAWRRTFSRRMALAAAFAHIAMRPGPARMFTALCALRPSLLGTAARVSGKLAGVGV